MRRVLLLGLLAAASCKQEPPVVEPQDTPLCPDLVVHEQGLSSSPAPRTSGAALTASAPLTEADGSQRMLVRFRPRTGVQAEAVSRDREDKVSRVGARLRYHWPQLDSMAVALTPEAREQLAKDPDVLSITPDRRVHALGFSALAPVSALLGAANTTGSVDEETWAVKMTQANLVWDANGKGVLDPGAPNGSGVTVCVIDSGIDPNHPELKAAYAGGHDYIDGDEVPEDKGTDGNWGGGHGTHVSGIIAAQLGSPGKVDPNDPSVSHNGMVGVAPGVTLLMARVLDTQGGGSTSDVISAVNWCVDQAKKTNSKLVISLSLGSSEPDPTEQDAFDKAWAAGALSVAASGNGGETATPETKTYPAAYPSVIAVGALTPDKKHATYSQGGPYLSLVAPGSAVFSTYLEGRAPFASLTASGTFFKSSVLDYVPFGSYDGPLIDCGLGGDSRSCPGATCEGFVAFVQRGGGIKFSDKVKNVRSQGARAVIIGNNDPADDDKLGFTLGGAADWPLVTAVNTTAVDTLRAAVGSTVHLSIEGNDYAVLSGTSMATPHVAGVAALVWSANPKLTNQQVRDILQNTAEDLSDSTIPGAGAGRDDVFGYGLVRAKDAVDAALKVSP